MSALIAMGLMALLLTKHFICDFLLQTGNIAVKKHNHLNVESYAHSAFHALGAILALGICGYSQFWLLGFFSGVIHYGIDWVKGNLTERLEMKPDNTYFWWLLGADQYAHGLTYCGVIAYVALTV